MLKSRIRISSYVIDFMDIGFDSKEIKSILEAETDNLLPVSDNTKLSGWEINFVFRFNTVKQILIYTRGKSYPKERYKEITVHIPIPTVAKANWGIGEHQQVQNEDHLDHLLANFHKLDVQYELFSNRDDYIKNCMRRAIMFSLKYGITINGQKLKYKFAE